MQLSVGVRGVADLAIPATVTLIEMLLHLSVSLWNLRFSCSVHDFEFPNCCNACSVNYSHNDIVISSSSTAVKFLGDGQERGLKSLQHRKWPQQPLRRRRPVLSWPTTDC